MSIENMDRMRFGLSIANLVGIVSFAFYIGGWKSEVNTHLQDKTIHMGLEQKMELFIPRQELNVKIDNMADDLEDIKRIIYSQYGQE